MAAVSVDNFISEQENKARTSQKNRTRCKTITVLHLFLETKNEERKMEDILSLSIRPEPKTGKNTSHLLSEVY